MRDIASLEALGGRGSAVDPLADWVGSSAAARRVRAALRAVAPSDATVLLTGETGTGKGLVARLLHATSRRAAGPLVHVDCAALAPSVIESELFGHERGAFTGADAPRTGRLEAVRDGTLFLDEVGELEPRLQAKLLRVLQDRAFERVGGGRTRRLAARVVAATNRDLRRAVAEGGFRADLYYRLQVVELELPPLRARPGDLPALVAHGLALLAGRLGCPPPRPTPAFLATLAVHAWPGNVRELWNLLERLLVHARGSVLDLAQLEAAGGPVTPPRLHRAAPPTRAGEPPGETDRARIAAVLAATGGNVSRAARRLGLPRGTLRHRIVRYGLAHLIPRD